MLVGRSSWKFSDRKLHRKIKALRDDKGEVGISMRIRWRLWAGGGGAHEWRTADPSASPDFLSRVVASVNCVWFSLGRTTKVALVRVVK
jgi:hypothetical protein